MVAETLAAEFCNQIAYRVGCKAEIVSPNVLDNCTTCVYKVLIQIDHACDVSAYFGIEDVTFSGSRGERVWASSGPLYRAGDYDEQIETVLVGHGVQFKKTLAEWKEKKSQGWEREFCI